MSKIDREEIRRKKLLDGLDLRSMIGLEIGALSRPFLNKEDGAVIYVDHADTETLRKKYKDNLGVDVEKIVSVDAVWGEHTLQEAIRGRKVNYVVASHVVEHVPDLIGWLGEIRSVLPPSGEVRLIVPDKRFTFDYCRAETRIESVLYSNVVRARVPQPQILIDFCLNAVKADQNKAWQGLLDCEGLERHHGIDHALNVARDNIRNGTYHDVHCWVFTPKSFARLFREMAQHDLIDFACTNFYDTTQNEIEFFVAMQVSTDKERIVQSWKLMESMATDNVPGQPFWRLRRRLKGIAAALNPSSRRPFARLNRDNGGGLG